MSLSSPPNPYTVLGVAPTASEAEIRRAYRDLSKQYHPDTSPLPPDLAQQKFLDIKAAYEILNNPETRAYYDRQRRYYQSLQRYYKLSQQAQLLRSTPRPSLSSSAYLEPHDRALSAGEVFALFILGLTLLGCVVLAVALGLARGEVLITPPP